VKSDSSLTYWCGMLWHSHIPPSTRTNRVQRSSAPVLSAAGLFVFFASACPACAQNRSDFPLSHKGSREISIRASEIVMINTGTALLSTAAVRYGLVLTDPVGKGRLCGTFEYTVDLLPMVLMTKPSLIYGAGLAPFGAKWNFFANPRLRPYGEAVFGAVYGTSHIPPGDTKFNFTVNAGVGLTLLSRGNQELTAGFDFSRLSNAYLGPYNPNLNGVAFVIEYHWLKPK